MDDLKVDMTEMPQGASPVLDNIGYVKYLDHMGTDDDIVESARLSYGRGTKKVRDGAGLINYLYQNMHTSPFEMVELKFMIRMPIFVMRQWVRHRTANLNEYSGRYSQMPRMWYVPEPEDIKIQDEVNKQASGKALNNYDAVQAQHIINAASVAAFEAYEKLLELKVSREMARIILPLNTYTEIVWKMDVKNLLHMLRLRDDSHAQPEIQAYARVIAIYVKKYFPITYAAYEEHRRRYQLTVEELNALFTCSFEGMSKSQIVKLKQIQQDMSAFRVSQED